MDLIHGQWFPSTHSHSHSSSTSQLDSPPYVCFDRVHRELKRQNADNTSLVVADVDVVPVVVGDGSAVLHDAPRGPGLDGVDRGVPDALAPDDVLDLLRGSIAHGPLGEGLAGHGGDLSSSKKVSKESQK